MENSVVVIDDQQHEWKKIVDSIKKLNLKCYPLIDQFKVFRKSIEEIIVKQIKKRIPPNPIQATIEMEGSFDARTRVQYQLGYNTGLTELPSSAEHATMRTSLAIACAAFLVGYALFDRLRDSYPEAV